MNLQFKEVDIENFIWDNISNGSLQDRGLDIPRGIYYRQFDLPGCGILDIINIQVIKQVDGKNSFKSVIINVFELKRGAITCKDVGQLARYIDCIETNIGAILDHFGVPTQYNTIVRGTIIGADIERDAAHLLSIMQYAGIRAYIFSFSLNAGISFIENDNADRENNYSITLDNVRRLRFREIARASYPILQDVSPKIFSGFTGSASSDTAEGTHIF